MSTINVENPPGDPADNDDETALREILLEAWSTAAELRGDLEDIDICIRQLQVRLDPLLFRSSRPLDQVIGRLEREIDRRDPEGADRRRAATMGQLAGLVDALPALVDRLQLLTQLLQPARL